MWRRKFLLGGIILMSLLIVGALNNFKSDFEFQSNIQKVKSIRLHADLANIQVISNHPELYIEYHGDKSLFGEPNIGITYSNNKAIINVVAIDKGWKKFLPGKRNKGNVVLNIPPRFLEEIHLETKNGDIDVNQIEEISLVSLISNLGTVRLNSFQGGLLNIQTGNGSIYLGEVEGQINIKNKVGSLKSLVLKRVSGENKIKVSNGNVKVKLPHTIHNIGLTISTKNGTIQSNKSELTILKKNSGKEISSEVPNGDTKIDISVLVGNIEID